MNETFELSLDPEVQAPRRARRAARDWLSVRHGDDERLDEIMLVLSELVTNAVVHAMTPFRLVLRHNAARLLAEVSDANPDPPVLRIPLPRIGGRGLHLVEQLSDAWGFERFGRGKCVWAEFLTRHDDDENDAASEALRRLRLSRHDEHNR